jgi:signal transduction histidine kinase/CheY-like chemotaxis protein
VAAVGLTPRAASAVVRFPPGEGLMGLALQARQPVISADVGSDSRFREQARARADNLVSGLMLPLLSRDRVSGMLAIFTQYPHAFSPEELDLLNSFGAQAAAALENARLYDELRHAYDEVQRAQGELVRSEKLRAVGQLGAGMAHDLNNVLAVILGHLELLKLRTNDATILESLGTLEMAATDGADVVRRIQDFARPRGASPLVPVDIVHLVAEALEITRPRWKDEPERRGVRIEVRSAISALPPVLGHAPEIREAMINLIFNAVDAMPQGGALTLRGMAGADQVQLTISDTGVGMSPDVRERIFEPFFTTKGPQGTGLGLSVVYGIMERHDGSIDVESQLGTGTTIRLRFQAAAEAPGRPAVAPTVPLPRTILLIDDDQVVRQTLGSLLRSAGHTVIEAESGAVGLARLGEARPDLVLTDLGMPEMTGREVAEAVKAATPSLPVVLLTGWGDQATEAESALHVDRILGKPVRLNDLLAVIAELTGPAGA